MIDYYIRDNINKNLKRYIPNFFLTAREDSMIESGIDEEDIIYFENTSEVENKK